MQIIEIFPTPVVVLTTGTRFLSLKNDLKMELTENKTGESHYISTNRYILNNPKYSELKEYVLKQTNTFMTDVLSVDGTARLTQSWVNCNAPGQHTHLHSHPNSIVSGVFYFELPEDSGDITFHNGFMAVQSYGLRPKYKLPKNKYADPRFIFKLGVGDLILFPSYLIHNVPVNTSNLNRWNVAFNSITENSLGDSDSLTELIF